VILTITVLILFGPGVRQPLYFTLNVVDRSGTQASRSIGAWGRGRWSDSGRPELAPAGLLGTLPSIVFSYFKVG
jgi:hypothetical protein